MNHLKLFENYGNMSLLDFLKEQNRIYNLIKNFLKEFKLDLQLVNSKLTIGDFNITSIIKVTTYSFWANDDLANIITIWFQDNRDIQLKVCLKDKDVKELIKFIVDPDLYRNSKKYNL